MFYVDIVFLREKYFIHIPIFQIFYMVPRKIEIPLPPNPKQSIKENRQLFKKNILLN